MAGTDSERGTLSVKILLITQWFDPEPTFKGMEFAQELRRRGHDVTVLTGYPNYPTGRIYPGYRMKGVSDERLEGIRVIRVPLYPSHDENALRRILTYVSFASSATARALLLPRPDVAYVYHPPASVGLPALALRYLRGVPYVYDVQDMWPDTLAATGMITSQRFLGVVHRWMNGVYRAASSVVVLSPGFARLLEERGVSSEKIRVIYNWTYEDALGQGDTASSPGPRAGAFHVLFAGTIGRAQGLDVVLDAAQVLADEGRGDIVFDVMGGGVDVPRLRDEAEVRGLDGVTFLPRRPPAEMKAVLARADALLIHLRDDPLFRVTIPSKTQSALLAGRPILMGVHGDAADLVLEADAGVVFPAGDGRGLADAARTLAALPRDERASMGERGRRYYLARLSLAAGANAFEDAFRDAATELRPGDRARRVMDVTAAAAGAIVLAVPAVAVAAYVRSRLGRPVFFAQQRPGRGGRPFRMLKFRTMTDARDENGDLLPDGERLTPAGRFLRSTSLDELPELVNVLRGEMSLVGPRPLLPRYTPYFTREESLRMSVRPGITGWAQINGRNVATWDDRLAMDVWYVRNRSLRLDLQILWGTVTAVFLRDGVVVDPESIMPNLDVERAGRVTGART